MDQKTGGQPLTNKSRQTAADIARNKVLAAYAKNRQNTVRSLGKTAENIVTGTYKQTPINANNVKNAQNSEAWKKYHFAWQNYYQKYYNDYYAKAAKSYVENERLKDERRREDDKRNDVILETPQKAVDPTPEEEENIVQGLKNFVRKRAKIEHKKSRRRRILIPIIAGVTAVLLILFLQYNRMIFAPIMAYVSPGNTEDTGISALDPTITAAVGPDNRLLIPKLNVDVPINFGISNDTASVNAAMEHGVAQFAIPGANAMPGEIGNLVLTGHSAGDIYSNNQYKFIFSGLERLTTGDLMYIDYQETRYTYTVYKMETVEPTDVAALVFDTDKPILTLITCTPLGTSRYRLLVFAEQINPAPSGATQQEYVDEGNTESIPSETMPENSPTFFERIWNWLTGNN